MRYNLITAGQKGPLTDDYPPGIIPKNFKSLKNGVYILNNAICKDYGYMYGVVVPEDNPFFNIGLVKYYQYEPMHFNGEELNKLLYETLIS